MNAKSTEVAGPIRTIAWLGCLALSAGAAQAQITASTSLSADHVRGPAVYAAEGSRSGLWRRTAAFEQGQGEGSTNPNLQFEGDARELERHIRLRVDAEREGGRWSQTALGGLLGWLGLGEFQEYGSDVPARAVDWVTPAPANGGVDFTPLLSESPVPKAALSAGGGALFQVTMGSTVLVPSQPDQLILLRVVNVSGVSQFVSGLTFNLQIGDSGPTSEGGLGSINGPNIQKVDLGTGTLFGLNNTGTQYAGGPPQAGSWTITTTNGTVSIAAGAELVLAQVRVDTTGISSGTYPFILRNDVPSESILGLSVFVGNLGQELVIDSIDGEILVPEPLETTVFTAAILGVGVVVRRRWQRGAA